MSNKNIKSMFGRRLRKCSFFFTLWYYIIIVPEIESLRHTRQMKYLYIERHIILKAEMIYSRYCCSIKDARTFGLLVHFSFWHQYWYRTNNNIKLCDEDIGKWISFIFNCSSKIILCYILKREKVLTVVIAVTSVVVSGQQLIRGPPPGGWTYYNPLIQSPYVPLLDGSPQHPKEPCLRELKGIYIYFF